MQVALSLTNKFSLRSCAYKDTQYLRVYVGQLRQKLKIIRMIRGLF
jgi:hypothetical protein